MCIAVTSELTCAIGLQVGAGQWARGGDDSRVQCLSTQCGFASGPDAAHGHARGPALAMHEATLANQNLQMCYEKPFGEWLLQCIIAMQIDHSQALSRDDGEGSG